jgi:hypothetical protein
LGPKKGKNTSATRKDRIEKIESRIQKAQCWPKRGPIERGERDIPKLRNNWVTLRKEVSSGSPGYSFGPRGKLADGDVGEERCGRRLWANGVSQKTHFATGKLRSSARSRTSVAKPSTLRQSANMYVSRFVWVVLVERCLRIKMKK